MMGFKIIRIIGPGIGLALLASAPLRAEWGFNLTPGVTEVSRSIHDLHMTIFWICVAIALVVFGVMFWSIFHHRKSRGAKAHHFHENTLVEVIWTLVPVLILVAMAVPATATLIKMYDSSEAELDVQITGYQWKWRYSYLDHGLNFFSSLATPREQISNQAEKQEHYLLEVDRHLVVPVGTKIRFLLTSNDVIHSWWVPALAVKKDAIPGFINEAWAIIDEPGIYRGQCAELCGQDHGFMPIVVEAVSREAFDVWLTEARAEQEAEAAAAEQTWTLDELMLQGEQVYQRVCAACHLPSGEGVPGAFPALKGSPIALGEVPAHIDVVLNGRSGTAMQAFREQLSATELAAVITYERNAWGNSMGEAVSPAQIVRLLESSAGEEGAK